MFIISLDFLGIETKQINFTNVNLTSSVDIRSSNIQNTVQKNSSNEIELENYFQEYNSNNSQKSYNDQENYDDQESYYDQKSYNDQEELNEYEVNGNENISFKFKNQYNGLQDIHLIMVRLDLIFQINDVYLVYETHDSHNVNINLMNTPFTSTSFKEGYTFSILDTIQCIINSPSIYLKLYFDLGVEALERTKLWYRRI
ncbi:18775_t:CDS:2 [Funneliformis geosporum]|uniref:18775_t:CDS:1 n=1 Tax=Funneliformis geosporum TaxID=1117311 RepID=A0A9W4WT74_9GLOM|nr:18775_t:CDS:2 [Funneliformis geosporum]